MKMKRNSFFAFCFSLIPGAAHMYMGFMKQGLSIMILLTLDIAAIAMLNLSVFGVVIPIIWFYSFFDAHHKRALPENEFNKLEDKSLFSEYTGKELANLTKGKTRPILAGVLIFFGFYILYNTGLDSLYYFVPNRFYNGIFSIVSKLPQTLVAIFIIYIGYRLIKGKKIELEDNSNNNNYGYESRNTSNSEENNNYSDSMKFLNEKANTKYPVESEIQTTEIETTE